MLFTTLPLANNNTLTDHICFSVDAIKSVFSNTAILIAGDFNHYKEATVCRMYNLKQIVSKCTRENAVLDKVLTDIADWYSLPDISSHIGKSDHLCVVVEPRMSRKHTPTNKVVLTSCASYYNRLCLKNNLESFNWSGLYNIVSCSEKLQYFNETLTRMINTHVPLKSVVRCSSDKPWITDHFKELVKKRQNALKCGHIEKYKQLRNEVNHKAKRLKKNYYNEQVINQKDPKKLYKEIKAITGCSKKSSLSSLANSLCNGDMSALCSRINEFFLSINNDHSPLVLNHTHSDDTVPDHYIISVEQVCQELMNLKPHKAPGPDDLPMRVLRDFDCCPNC